MLADNTNAETGVCPTAPLPTTTPLPPAMLDCYSEYLPKPGYVGTAGSAVPAMHFRVTARDADPHGGGTSSDDVVLTLDPTAGPFAVTSQAAAGDIAQAGTPLTVTWSVNGTAALAPTVKVTLSTDNGAHFDQVLAAATANDGSEALVLPNTPTSQARLKIEAVDNYFFDTSDGAFTLTPADATAPDTVITGGPAEGAIVLAPTVKYTYTATESPASFACALDTLAIPCDGVGATLGNLKGGTHVFTVAGRDSRGNVDVTPATRTFTVPIDDTRLRHRGDWDVKKAAAAFGGEYSTSKDKGDKLTYAVRDATRIALVVTTAQRLGPVKVYLGKDLLRTVRLRGKRHAEVVKLVSTFAAPRSGKLKIVVGKDKRVKIEGVAVVTAP